MKAIYEQRLREKLSRSAGRTIPSRSGTRTFPVPPTAWLGGLSAATVLVFAPHPDDEVLAIGGTLHRLVSGGSNVCVVFLTSGENNGLVQRFVERRLLLDADAHDRWGEQRRRESKACLRRLGLVDEDSRFLGFPDGLLMSCRSLLDEAVEREINEVQPDLVLSPSLADLHSDHRATSLAVRRALSGQDRPAPLYEYLVHGGSRHPAAVSVELDPAEVQIKMEAILCHSSQMALSRRRFLAFAGVQESLYEPLDDRPRRLIPLRRAIEVLRG